MSTARPPLVVVGSGFAGSLIAMIAQRLGRPVVLLERGRHPRFAIGESTTPLTNLLLEEIADEFDLPFLRPLSKWGTWQRDHPEMACGLKRGFTFLRHELGRPFPLDRARQNQLLVGASPADRVADTHWYRPDFDHFLVRQAVALGVDYRDEVELASVTESTDGIRLRGARHGRPFELNAGFLIDASGQRGFLHRRLGLLEKPLAGFPPTQALFAHFTNVAPLPTDLFPGTPPYPPEDAAMHHLFDGGWVWVLKFNNGITSAGVAATDEVADRLGLRLGAAGWNNLLRELPTLADSFGSASAITPFICQPRVAFQSATVTGPRWALLPSAAGFVDPLLSTGFPLTLLGIQRLGRLLRDSAGAEVPDGLADYASVTTREFEAAAALVAALYRSMNDFNRFKDLSLLYFAAASFSEAARRLGRADLAPNFLLCGHPTFGPRLRELCAAENPPTGRIREAIAPFDVAGLTDRSRDPWYPADPADLYRHAAKLGASEPEIAAMLARCGLVAPA
ncbi:MAG TPA: tryptophan 7-halogenase [Lacunisphaera sp.]|jgi:FADH2 O2-dependent halogenase|nr:tryptophan 7-halogenase [Lacunisphaera sp.]